MMNSPFSANPPAVARAAVARLVAAIEAAPLPFRAEAGAGKMFGVLVVEAGGAASADCQGPPAGMLRPLTPALSFLAAFSGQLGGVATHAGFVPPVFDFLAPDGWFRREEAQISALNVAIAMAEHDSLAWHEADALRTAEAEAAARVAAWREEMAAAKRRRDALRAEMGAEKAPAHEPEEAGRRAGEQKNKEMECAGANACLPGYAALIRESQFQKAELRRLKARCAAQLAPLRERVAAWQARVAAMKAERARRSDALQHWLFDRFVLLNARGECRSAAEIFASEGLGLPPAGTGECCAPKLLHYAFQHQLRPVAIAEFWYGAPPRQEIRHHLCFYPACRGKCGPLLRFMLQGLECEPAPTAGQWSLLGEREAAVPDGAEAVSRRPEDRRPQSNKKGAAPATPQILYDDAHILVCVKPHGLLSVQGKDADAPCLPAVLGRMTGEELLPAHRLDMDTSGLVVLAKSARDQAALQRQFEGRTVRKRYEAVVEPPPAGVAPSGVIRLPLRPDIDDRPRQVVDAALGKEAVTRYALRPAAAPGGPCRVSLWPQTGRTHQLRVHCAHPQGLAAPIVGDRLYGHGGTFLHLCAVEMAFRHPATGEPLTFRIEPDF